jgi:hypothetical protein
VLRRLGLVKKATTCLWEALPARYRLLQVCNNSCRGWNNNKPLGRIEDSLVEAGSKRRLVEAGTTCTGVWNLQPTVVRVA